MSASPLFTYQSKFSSAILTRVRKILWIAAALMLLAAYGLPKIMKEETGALGVFFLIMAGIDIVMAIGIPIHMKKIDAHLYSFFEDRMEVFIREQPLYEISYKDISSIEAASVSAVDAERGLTGIRLHFRQPLTLMVKKTPSPILDILGLPAAEMPQARIQEIVEKKRRA